MLGAAQHACGLVEPRGDLIRDLLLPIRRSRFGRRPAGGGDSAGRITDDSGDGERRRVKREKGPSLPPHPRWTTDGRKHRCGRSDPAPPRMSWVTPRRRAAIYHTAARRDECRSRAERGLCHHDRSTDIGSHSPALEHSPAAPVARPRVASATVRAGQRPRRAARGPTRVCRRHARSRASLPRSPAVHLPRRAGAGHQVRHLALDPLLVSAPEGVQVAERIRRVQRHTPRKTRPCRPTSGNRRFITETTRSTPSSSGSSRGTACHTISTGSWTEAARLTPRRGPRHPSCEQVIPSHGRRLRRMQCAASHARLGLDLPRYRRLVRRRDRDSRRKSGSRPWRPCT